MMRADLEPKAPHGEGLIAPHGSLPALASPTRAAELKELACHYPSWELNERQLCDLELLLNGGFAPLTGFLGRRDYESVVGRMRLSDGTLWPIPVTLDVGAEVATQLDAGAPGARDAEGALLATLRSSRCGSRTWLSRRASSTAPKAEAIPASPT
jgi:sulfate adenylyltransferase